MPTYEYACKTCGSFEKEQRISDPKLDACPSCGAKVERLISRSSFSLKGGGWGSDGYRSTGGKQASGGELPCGASACPSGGCAANKLAN